MQEIKTLIDARLHDWLQSEAAYSLTDEARQLLSAIETVVLAGGKRFRPQLLYTAYQSYGDTNDTRLLDVALALEFHHQFLLIHDDVMDYDLVRHSMPNIAGMYAAQGLDIHDANSMAILAGNLLCSYADQALLTSSFDPALTVRLSTLLHAANGLVHQGQQLDISATIAHYSGITQDTLLHIASLKTASYTTHLPLNIAAELLGLDEVERAKITVFAESFGILYQLVNDYMDYFDTSATFKKAGILRDFTHGAVTLPLWHMLQTATSADLDQILELQQAGSLTASDFSTVLQLLRKYDSDQFTLQLIREYTATTHAALQSLNISNSTQLTDLINQYCRPTPAQ